jgi:hypothetical protein
MRTQANWFVDQVPAVDEETDPFTMPIEEVGTRIDLRDPKAALQLRLAELVRREGSLYETHVKCPIKDRPDSTCHACPVSQAHDTEVALGVLCRLGREQEVVLTELAVLTCASG